jgi:uncharacterized paraquat-inducible protein A
MATNKHVECNNCDAVFKINHDMDDMFYQVKYCPFCQEPLDDDQDFEQSDSE